MSSEFSKPIDAIKFLDSYDFRQLCEENAQLRARLDEYEKPLELIAGGSEFQCEVGERNCIAAARAALEKGRGK